MVIKKNINLLQADLFPEKPLLTLGKVVACWLGLLLLMAIWTIVTDLNYKEATIKYNVLKKDLQQKQRQGSQLETRLANRQVTPELKQKLSTLKLVMQHKDALLNKLTDSNETFAGGFVMIMNNLSKMHHKDIRLQKISINSKAMTFSGLALNPQAVPAWLAGFKQSSLLSGKEFLNFKLNQSENNLTEFVVSSAEKEGKK
ncbi:PilN domain-containing protein [Colwellia sp. E2M01]|uniref:PilN domain-containing protein n=1 Tax=Colwellia sp. E2M01 TaxID=2841561 RepID=UPI001C089950|nr:PilN domain-containing protein [Colwellia sp. E2M01]MBU2870314.1 PilN domain-containing protein [Colwellia sp. E2M01]